MTWAAGEGPAFSPPFRRFNEDLIDVGGEDLDNLAYRRISPEGSLLGGRPAIAPSLLLSMYGWMVLGREFDDQASRLSTFREIVTYAPHKGQEAAQVGYGLALEPRDWFVPMYRDNVSAMIRGVPILNILQKWAGDERGMKMPQNVNVLPFSTVVGSNVPHGAGLAMARKMQGDGSVTLVTIGDGATSKGDFHEGLNMAGTFRLPLLVAIQNNQYAISMPRKKQSASKTLAQKAIAYGIDGILVDGNDVIASYEATRHAAQKAREGGGPTLLEFHTYRMGHHSAAELVSRKLQPQDEIEAWSLRDPIARFEKYLQAEGLLDEAGKAAARREAAEAVHKGVEELRRVAPPSPEEMFASTYESPTSTLREQLRENFLVTVEEDPGSGISEPRASGGKPVNIRNAVNMALRQEMELNDKVVVFGEDVGRSGGVFQVTRGLQELFGEERAFDTPLAEVGIAGLFLGLSVGGMIPVAEFQFDGFVAPAYDQIINNISRMRNRSRGRFAARGVIRFPYGAGIQASEHHVESPEAYFAHTPGVKVVVPSNPYDAKGLFASALADENPVVYMEPKKLYDSPKVPVPEERYLAPIGKAKVVREGQDLTLISFGAMMVPTMEAAEVIQAEDHVSAEVIDLRTISPLDAQTIVVSASKTGRVIIVHEAQQSFGVGAEIAAQVAEKALDSLRAPVKRVAGFDVISPMSKLAPYYRPSVERIVKTARGLLSH